jgi:nicotinamide mononucleotide transporter
MEHLLLNKKKYFHVLEWLAVLLNIGFTVLFQLNNPWSFVLGIAGPILLAMLSFQRHLFADVFLQLAYSALAVYGYLQFVQTPSLHESSLLHAMGISASLTFGILLGIILKRNTTAALPLLDALITAFSLWATIILMSGWESAWLYFIFINLASVALFFKRDLKIIGFLFILYTLLAIQGYFHIV